MSNTANPMMSLPALKRHVLFTEYDAVMQICQPLKRLHIEGFIYMQRFMDGSFIDLSTQLDWSAYFLKRYLCSEYDHYAI